MHAIMHILQNISHRLKPTAGPSVWWWGKKDVSISETSVITVCGLTISSIKKGLLSRPDEFLIVYAMRSQNMMTRATNRKRRDRNCSSMCCGVPGAAAKIKENKLWFFILLMHWYFPAWFHRIKHLLLQVTVTTHPKADYFSITAHHWVFYSSYATGICWYWHFLLMNGMDFF